MLINVVTTTDNGAGLQTDAMLLKAVLENMGHSVRLVNRLHPASIVPADLSIFGELIVPEMMKAAPRNWFLPNPEWYFPKEWGRHLKNFELVLCKTHDCQRLMQAHHQRCWYTGFMAVDYDDPKIERRREFLHVKGKSTYKNTNAIIGAWLKYKIQTPLTIVSKRNPLKREIPNVTWRGVVSLATLRSLYNSRLFHLCPSEYEGYGHYIHEGLSCGAIVVTTDKPPMNEFKGCPDELRIPGVNPKKTCIATLHKVKPEDVKAAVDKCLALGGLTIMKYQEQARNEFLAANQEFEARLQKVFALT